MALLTKEAENKISSLLVADGLADGNLVKSVADQVWGTFCIPSSGFCRNR